MVEGTNGKGKRGIKDPNFCRVRRFKREYVTLDVGHFGVVNKFCLAHQYLAVQLSG